MLAELNSAAAAIAIVYAFIGRLLDPLPARLWAVPATGAIGITG
jgi:hypothetical protein